jgi:ribosomal protein S6--L-glutamate ligase
MELFNKPERRRKVKRSRPDKTLIGKSEWCALPDLGLPAVKARVDTGARTSALHAFDIRVIKKGEHRFVRFKINPLQNNSDLVCDCEAPLIQKRDVISSNGEREKRCVIRTTLVFSGVTFPAEITLTSRHKMQFRMLLGREALKKARFIVDPSKSLLLGRMTDVIKLYE